MLVNLGSNLTGQICRRLSLSATAFEADKTIDFNARDRFRDVESSALLVNVLASKLYGIKATELFEKTISNGGFLSIEKNTAIRSLVKNTLLKTYVGGESCQEMVKTGRKLEKLNIATIVDFAAECSADHQKTPNSPHEEFIFPPSAESDVVQRYTSWLEIEKNYTFHKDSHLENYRSVFESIDGASKLSMYKCIAHKVTSLVGDSFMAEMSAYLKSVKNHFHAVGNDSKRINISQFGALLERVGITLPNNQVTKLFAYCNKDRNTGVSCYDILLLFDPGLPLRHIYKEHMTAKCIFPDDSNFEKAHGLNRKIEEIAKYASKRGVKVSVDAEHTWYQDYINHCAIRMMRTMNISEPLVMNTYQCYLKSSHSSLLEDIEASIDYGFVMGVKLVRGAYLVQEKSEAALNSRPSPIHDTAALTSENYNNCAKLLLNQVANGKTGIILATHNENSVKKCIEQMSRLGIAKNDERIIFAQLYGMAEHITLVLAKNDYRVAKYLPYGSMDQVLPYLLRRAQENNSIMDKNRNFANSMIVELLKRLPGVRLLRRV